MNKKQITEQLNSLYEKAPVTSMQANIRQDIKADRVPMDKNSRMARTDNQINKIIHAIKTKGNNPKLQRALITAKKKRFNQLRKMTT